MAVNAKNTDIGVRTNHDDFILNKVGKFVDNFVTHAIIRRSDGFIILFKHSCKTRSPQRVMSHQSAVICGVPTTM